MSQLDSLFTQAAGQARSAGAVATSVFGVHHGTQLAGSPTTFETRYVLVRVGTGFGACAVDALPLDEGGRAALCGMPVAHLLEHGERAIRVAALDAWLAHARPWSSASPTRVAAMTTHTLPAGTPEERAAARDDAVAGLLDILLPRRDAPADGARRSVCLIGVVNPLVAAIRERGFTPLPCDLWLDETAFGDPVAKDLRDVVPRADAVIATGMTLGNDTYTELSQLCRAHGIPLALYAQTGSAIARELVGTEITAASCEPFPFSQFTAGPSELYTFDGTQG